MTSTLTPETIEQIYELLTVSETPNGDTHNMEFISDPAHGWLKVPHLAYQLAGAPASSHSYTDGEFCYLEEDSDAPRFLDQVGITVRPDGGGLERDGGYIVWIGGVDDHFDTLEAANAAAQEWRDKDYEDVRVEKIASSWYIPSRELQHQRRYNEVSPRDMKRIHDPAYVNPFAAETLALFEAVKTPDGSTSVQLAKDQKFLDDHFQIIHIR